MGQAETLDVIAERDGWRMGELATALRIDASTATRSIDPLVRLGLATRREDPSSARAVVVSLTRKGVARHAELKARSRDIWQNLLADFTASELADFADFIDRVVDALDAIAASDHVMASRG